MEWRTQRPAKRPGMIEPCIPTRASKPPAGPQWIHEIKHEGYRLIARKPDGRVRLFTRKGFDWTGRYPRISAAVAALRTASATIDGEAVWRDGDGLAGGRLGVRLGNPLNEPMFSALSRAPPTGRAEIGTARRRD